MEAHPPLERVRAAREGACPRHAKGTEGAGVTFFENFPGLVRFAMLVLDLSCRRSHHPSPDCSRTTFQKSDFNPISHYVDIL